MNKIVGSLLILSVTAVLLTLLLSIPQSYLIILAVTIILVTLILVVGGGSDLVPCTLKIILSEIRRTFHF